MGIKNSTFDAYIYLDIWAILVLCESKYIVYFAETAIDP